MRFTQSFMTELYKYIGPDEDVPAGDIGVGAREIGYMFGQYKRFAAVTKPEYYGQRAKLRRQPGPQGSDRIRLRIFRRRDAEGPRDELRRQHGCRIRSGNVSIYAMEKAMQLGAKVVACSDSNGYVYDPQGINLDTVKRLKEVERRRIKDYVLEHPHAEYGEGCEGIWTIPCDIALPCATQNEISEQSAKQLVRNGVKAIGEGANMPSTLEAVDVFLENGVLFAPAKAANAGGVSVSALEMSQNSMRYSGHSKKSMRS